MRSATIASRLSAIKYFHRISRGVKLDTTLPVAASALSGAARSHADVGNQATVRRPISWGNVARWRGSDSFVAWWGSGSVAYSAFIVLFLDPRVGNVCGNKVANSRVALFRNKRTRRACLTHHRADELGFQPLNRPSSRLTYL